MAATRQINEHGYRGASVDRISAASIVTKGAFYHHNEAKDELVAACFRRSFGIAREAQRRVAAMPGTELHRLVAAVAGLIRFQLGPEGPLLRTSVLSSMPQEHQVEIIVAVLQGQPAVLRDDRRRRRRRFGPRRSIRPSPARCFTRRSMSLPTCACSRSRATPDIVDRFMHDLFGGLSRR